MMEKLFRPLTQIEEEQYLRIKNRVFSIFSSGHITDRDKIISVCKVVYDEHEVVLKESISQMNVYSLILFVSEQYEEYARVNAVYHQLGLGAADEKEWRNYASHARRGIKYLLEYLCQNHTNLQKPDGEKLTKQEQLETISRIFISIEEMCSTYIRIDGYKFLFDSVELYLDDKQYIYFNVPQDSDPCNIIDVRSEKREISALISGVPYGINVEAHSLVMKSSFHQHLGLTYGQLIDYLRKYIEFQTTSVAFVLKNEIIADLQRACGITAEQATLAIHGFSVRNINLADRVLYSPKQEHRAYHRGFFEFVLENVTVLIFSRTMALEALDILVNNTCYQKLPEEWKTPAIERQLTKLSNNAGKWFEDVLHDNLKRLGINSIRSLESYHYQGKTNYLPENVGEIDFIGYLSEDNALLVIEAKNVRFSTEPKLFRDDLSKFITGKKSYVEKFKTKCQWVLEHLPEVIGELNQRGIEVNSVERVYKVMVIFTPSPVERRISEFSCINIVRFVEIIKSGNFSVFSVANLSPISKA